MEKEIIFAWFLIIFCGGSLLFIFWKGREMIFALVILALVFCLIAFPFAKIFN